MCNERQQVFYAGAFVVTEMKSQARGRKLFGKAGVEAQGFAQDFQVLN